MILSLAPRVSSSWVKAAMSISDHTGALANTFPLCCEVYHIPDQYPYLRFDTRPVCICAAEYGYPLGPPINYHGPCFDQEIGRTHTKEKLQEAVGKTQLDLQRLY